MAKFSKNFWTVIAMEFTERGSYYGVMSVFAIYLSMGIDEGGLGFSKERVGIIQSIITPIIYFVPIISGVLAEKFGYRRVLGVAFVLMSLGYFLTGYNTSYGLVFASLLVMALGAGAFKPVVSGTIARETTKETSTLGFGIFYMSVNLGSFFFPLILVPILKDISWNYIFYLAGACTGALLLVNLFIFKEPKRPVNNQKIGDALKTMFGVLRDKKFMTLIVIYSGFWVLYFQMFGAVLWYLKEYIDVTPINNVVNSFLSIFVDSPSWKFDIEHITVLNAFTIIALQLVISNIVKRFKALPTMISGVIIGTLGMLLLALSSNVWVFIAGIIIFSLGEMTAHPKFSSYIGIIAPEDKKALYMGYSFLTSVIGSAIAGVLGAFMYGYFTGEGQNIQILWLLFSLIGVATAIGLYVYNKKTVQDA
ncbi:MAG: MFS transporter [Rikenellaceae bacterium]